MGASSVKRDAKECGGGGTIEVAVNMGGGIGRRGRDLIPCSWFQDVLGGRGGG